MTKTNKKSSELELLFRSKPWLSYLGEDLQELFDESFLLLDFAKSHSRNFHDYSFIVFPAAKAYEGFLKKAFLDMQLITEDDYWGKHFRIGRSLSPRLVPQPDESWVYAKLADYCNGKETPEKLWRTWKKSRNILFHWFPGEKNAITQEEARVRIKMILDAIDALFHYCSVQ